MKFKKEEIKQLRKNFVDRLSWIKVKTKKSDLKCPECKRLYSDIQDEKIALMIVEGKSNQHLCNDCADKYIALGIEDLDKKVKNKEKIKENLLFEIKNMYNNNIPYRIKKLDEYDIEKLTNIRDEKLKSIEHQNFLDSIDTSSWILENYLIEQYEVIMNKKYLKHTSQIPDYFNDRYYDMFDCGQGYAQDEVEVMVFINNKFYSVKIMAEIGSQKQDRGDRLYWVEGIESISVEEIEKPKEKLKKIYKYNFNIELLAEDKIKLDNIIEQFQNNNKII